MPCACKSSRPLPEPEGLPLWDVAVILSVSEKTAKRMCQSGELPHFHVGAARQYRVRKPAPGQPWTVEPSEATRCTECYKPPAAPRREPAAELSASL